MKLYVCSGLLNSYISSVKYALERHRMILDLTGTILILPLGKHVEDILVEMPKIVYEKCTACLTCFNICPHNAIVTDRKLKPLILYNICSTCMKCLNTCPSNAITKSLQRIGFKVHIKLKDKTVLTYFVKDNIRVEVKTKLLDKMLSEGVDAIILPKDALDKSPIGKYIKEKLGKFQTKVFNVGSDNEALKLLIGSPHQ